MKICHQQTMLVGLDDLDLHVVVQQVIDHLRVIGRSLCRELTAVHAQSLDRMILDLDALDLSLLDFTDEIGVVDTLPVGRARAEIVEDRHQHQCDDNP